MSRSTFAAGVGIPFETKMTEMSRTLYGQMEESAKLDEVIRGSSGILMRGF